MFTWIRRIAAHSRKDDGASAVEYGLLVAAVAALVVLVVFALGNIARETFSKTCDKLKANAVPANSQVNCAGAASPLTNPTPN